ncbi:MAG: hypothetical protein KC466_06360, partial [Myxococcales bacterium]|nr:hypothetical protein [Myxococcales bacterium]
ATPAARAAESIAEGRYFEPLEIPGVDAGERVARWDGEKLVAVPSQGIAGDGRRVLVLGESLGGPDDGRSSARAEVRARDPLTRDSGYLYVASAASVTMADGGPDGITADAGRIRGRCYAVEFDREDPALFSAFAVTRECGGTGRDLLDRLVSETTVTIRGIGADLHYDRSGVHSRVIDLDAGPLRTERHIGYVVDLPFGGTSAETEQRSYFYPYHYVYPVHLALPALAGVLLGGLEIEIATDWRADAGPFTFTHGDRPGRPLAEGEGDGAPFDGWRMSGPGGTFLNFLRLGADAPFEAFVRNAPAPDGLRRVGFVLRSKRTFGVEAWDALSTTIVPRAGDDRGPAAFQALLDHPLEVEVHPR